MSYCLNPLCRYPRNLDTAQFCQSCGSSLRLNDRYRPLRPIGQGGFGKTFLAVDEHLPSKPRCVIKQFVPGYLGGDRLDKATELFHQEAVQLDHLGQHPQIPKLLAHFSQPPLHYLVQTYIQGENLETELARKGTFSELDICALLMDLLPVLIFIHEQQVIHRDIKPANIIRRQIDQQLVLVDFGASKFATETALERTGTVIGSAGYAAPEQASGKSVFASDLYSLGVTCIHLLTNVPPFDLFSFTEGDWVWRNYLPQPLQPQLAKFLDQLLQPAINQRFPSAAIALQALRSLDLDMDELDRVIPPMPPLVYRQDDESDQGAIADITSPPNTVPQWSPATVRQALVWRCVRTLSGHANSVATVAISPSGKLLASAGFDRTIKLWHLGTGALITTFCGHSEPVLSVIFTPDSQSLISGSVDDTIRIWDIDTEALLYTLTNNAASVMALSVDLSPDGQALVSGSDDHTVKIWQLTSGRLLQTLVHPRAVTSVDISPDGQFLVSACNDNIIRIWNFGTGQLIHTLTEHTRDVNAVVISPDSRFLVSGGSDNTTKIWDTKSGRLLRTLTGHLDWVRAVTISPSGRILASASDDHTIKLWSLPKGRLRHTLAGQDGHRKGINAIAFSPDSRTLVSGSGDRTVKIWRYQ